MAKLWDWWLLGMWLTFCSEPLELWFTSWLRSSSIWSFTVSGQGKYLLAVGWQENSISIHRLFIFRWLGSRSLVSVGCPVIWDLKNGREERLTQKEAREVVLKEGKIWRRAVSPKVWLVVKDYEFLFFRWNRNWICERQRWTSNRFYQAVTKDLTSSSNISGSCR